MEKDKNFLIRTSPELHQAAHARAAQMGVHLSYIVRQFLTLWVREELSQTQTATEKSKQKGE